jgi:uncharacterized protein YecE (DUF72 family)
VAALRIGCSGWNYPHWREIVYPRGVPQRRWLEHYATLFDTVEVNATFYRLPSRETVAAWAAATPAEFVVTAKASRYLTHVRRLREVADGAALLAQALVPLAEAGKLGPVLWQLPESFPREPERLAAALDAMPPGRHAFEFRHASWFAPDVLDLLRAHGAALAIGDHPERPFQTLELTAGWTYLRLHAGRGADGVYEDAELRSWARRILAWHDDDVDVYGYFNNDWRGHAVENAGRLRELLAAR